MVGYLTASPLTVLYLIHVCKQNVIRAWADKKLMKRLMIRDEWNFSRHRYSMNMLRSFWKKEVYVNQFLI